MACLFILQWQSIAFSVEMLGVLKNWKKIYREGLCLSAHASASLHKSSVCLVTLTPLASFLWREGKQDFIEKSDSTSCGREGSAE